MAVEKANAWDSSLATKDDLSRLEKSINDIIDGSEKYFSARLEMSEKYFSERFAMSEKSFDDKFARFESVFTNKFNSLESVLKDTIKLEVKASISSLKIKVNFILWVLGVCGLAIINACFKQYFPWG